MSLLPTDIMIGARITASSYDNTSDACKGDKCKPDNVGNDGVAREGDDTTFWQSAPDPSCANQWVQAEFAKPYTIQNFTIEYASLGNKFSTTNKFFQVVLNPLSPTEKENVIGITTCITTNMTDTDGLERFDTCQMQYPRAGVSSIRFTWGLNKAAGETFCQMNVDEVRIL
ncbi:UNVERIFIED_CONTAM: hypothetical protein HDU68_007746 [Siphonaria sp. JEL0065]|nr:hypothetical protein HDU68_007746 [Siphonaria sp. JEL0065]